jgi:polar amino acid transport system substrate-binding protein
MTRRSLRLPLTLLAAFAALVSACSASGAAPSAAPQATAVNVMPAGAAPVTAAPAGSGGGQTCNGGHVTASLKPEGNLPPVGQMPAGSYMATIERRGYLIAGVDQNTLLWGYRNPASGALEGFDIDMVDQVAQAIFGTASRHVHYIIVPNANRVSAVQSGQVDIVAETMTINCDREKSVDFSTEYYDAGQAILVRDGSPIRSPADLQGRTVCAASKSTSLDNLAALPHPPKLIAVINQTDCLVMLQQGQVDAISTDDTILDGLAAQDPNVAVLPRVRLSDEPYGMAISKAHPDFTRFVNGVLARERSDGTWTSIWKHWIGQTVGGSPPSPPQAVYRS